MRTIKILSVFMAFAFMAPVLTWAESGMGSMGDASGMTPGKTVNGSVTNIDTVNNAIQVKDNTGMIQTVVMDQDAVVTKNGQNATINDLKVGDLVSVKITPNPMPHS